MNLAEVVIVLSRPAESGNVGAVCRAMMNMGLSRLRIVPASGAELDGDVIAARAVHAARVWEQADFSPALRRLWRTVPRSSALPGAAATDARPILLTPEKPRPSSRNGPARRPWSSAMSVPAWKKRNSTFAAWPPTSPPARYFRHSTSPTRVQIFCYELRLKLSPGAGRGFPGWVPLGQERLDALVQSVTGSLESLGFYKQPGRAEQERFFRDLFARAGVTHREAEYLAGIFEKAARLAKKPE